MLQVLLQLSQERVKIRDKERDMMKQQQIKVIYLYFLRQKSCLTNYFRIKWLLKQDLEEPTGRAWHILLSVCQIQ